MTNTPATNTKTTKATKAPANVTSLAAKRATKSAAKAAPAKTTKAAPAKRTTKSAAHDSRGRGLSEAAAPFTPAESARVDELIAQAKTTKATTSKRAAKAAPASAKRSAAQRVAEGNGLSSAPLFQDHVHPETYDAGDDLDVRRLQLHTKWDHCELSSCTWAGQIDSARAFDVLRATQLRAELRDAAKAERSTITPEQAAQLVELYAAHVRAQVAFEQLCAQLVVDEGASPSHVGKAISIGNSQVRRIVWRARPEAKPEGY